MDRKLLRLLLSTLSLLVAAVAFNPSAAAARPAFCAGQCLDNCPDETGQNICVTYCEETDFVCTSQGCPVGEVNFFCTSDPN